MERCTVIGNSLGGIVAQLVAIELGNRVGKLVLIGTGASRARNAADTVASLRGAPDRLKTKEAVARLLAHEPDSTSEMDTYIDALMAASKEFIAIVAGRVLELDLRPRLRAITAQTLIVRGELDPGRTREHVHDLLEGIPNCDAIEMAGAGHSPQVDSSPEFTRILRQFLERDQVEDS